MTRTSQKIWPCWKRFSLRKTRRDSKCTELMLKVHHEGRAIVWSGNRARSESYCVKLQVAGLQSTIERDE